jgi:hypothetical protein
LSSYRQMRMAVLFAVRPNFLSARFRSHLL